MQREKPTYVKRREIAAEQELTRERYEKHLAGINELANQLAVGSEKQREAEHSRQVREWITIAFLFLTVVAAAISNVIFYQTLVQQREDASNQYRILQNQQSIMQGQLNEMIAVRWPRIIFVKGELRGKLAIEKGFNVAIEYRNIGRETAKKFTHNALAIYPDASVMDNEAQFAKLTRQLTESLCKITVPTDAGIQIQPSAQNELIAQTKPEPRGVMQTVVNGRRLAVIIGCVAYESSRGTEKQPFCVYLKGNGRGTAFSGRCPGRSAE